MSDDTGRYRLAFSSGNHPGSAGTLARTRFVSEQTFGSLENAAYAARSCERERGIALHPGIQQYDGQDWLFVPYEAWHDLTKGIDIV